jgi:hypothetical protein
MKQFSKFVFICNVCFAIAVISRYVQFGNAIQKTEALGFQPIVSTIVILGYAAVCFNFIFLLTCLLVYLFKKTLPIPEWILIFNLILFFVALLYFLY